MNAVTHLAGDWPTTLKVVSRRDVEIRWTEHAGTNPVTNYRDGSVEWKDRLDVEEYAYYVGPVEGLHFEYVDMST